MRVGYACISLGNAAARSQRTTVLRHVTPEKLRGLIHANLDGLQQVLQYNETHGLRLFRIGNAFIPFASHAVNTLAWWSDFGWRFREIGRWVRAHGHRLSFHASHFTILNSMQPEVAEASLADVEYMGRVLEAMELGPEHKIILHVGVKSPTAEEAIARFARAVDRVASEHRRHLVIENDDRHYSAEEVIAVSHRTGLPVVVDVLHHAVVPGAWGDLTCSELLERVFATWAPEQGVPKIHFSSQDPDKKPGAHAYGIDREELARFLDGTRMLPQDFDIMFECKGKDLAVREVLDLLEEDPRYGRLLQAA